MFAHEGLDARIRLPLYAVVLIASDVHEVIGEDVGDFSNKSIEEFIGAFSRRIHYRIEDAELAFDVERAGAAGKIRISDEPCAAVPGNIELGHNPDATIARVRDNFAGLLLSIEKSIGAQPSELGESPTLHAEALVFTQMPVENVQLHSGHPVERAFNNVERH